MSAVSDTGFAPQPNGCSAPRVQDAQEKALAPSNRLMREPEIDPIWHLMPPDQIDRVLNQDMCDICPEFLGFTDIYQHIAAIIPLHWTIIDLGCAYSPQALLFDQHRAYIGVDLFTKERFSAPNTTHYEMPIREFLDRHLAEFDQEETFAICSYVPPWGGGNNLDLARRAFRNVFTYYPHGGPDIELMRKTFAKAKQAEIDAKARDQIADAPNPSHESSP